MRCSWRNASILLFGLLLAVGWSTAAAAAPDPPGNNGTVKVEGEPIDSLHDDDSHVSCAFFLQWYGFDAGTRHTTVTFEAQPPTGPPQLLLTDSFTFVGTGPGADLDAQRAYDLRTAIARVTPQAQQGVHVSLTVATDLSHGADTKHKVFWVTGCTAPETVPPSPGETPPPPDTPPPPPEVVPPATPPDVGELPPPPAPAPEAQPEVIVAAPAATPAAAPAAEVLGLSLTRAVPAQVAGGHVALPSALARTGGGSTVPLTALGAALVLAGVASKRVARRRS